MSMIDPIEKLKVEISVHLPWLLEVYEVKTLKLEKNQTVALIERLEQCVHPKTKQNLDSWGT